MPGSLRHAENRHARTRQLVQAFLLAIALAASASGRAVQSSPTFSNDGPGTSRASFSEFPWERIDLLTGALSLTFTDLVLPGNAGMDVRIERSYRGSPGTWRVGVAGFPLWIEDPDGYFNPETGETRQAKAVTYDGVRHALYPMDGANVSATWVSQAFWVWAPATRTLQLPNGWVAYFRTPDLPSASRLQYVQDPFGNRIEVDWDVSPHSLEPVEVRQVPANSPGQTRTVTFNRQGGLTMAYDGRTWTYNAFDTVVVPGGATWEVDTWLDGTDEWLKVTTPAGGEVQYRRVRQQFPDDDPQHPEKWHRVVNLRQVGGRAVSPGTWTLTYVPGGIESLTTVTYPTSAASPNNRIAEYRHQWTFQAQDHHLDRVRILSDGVEASIQTLTHDYRRVTPWSPAFPVVTADVRQQDGRTFTTTFAYQADDAAHRYGDYHRPYQIVEQGELTRMTTLTFDYDFAAGLGPIRRVAAETVTVGGEFVTTTFSHQDGTGFLEARTQVGQTTTFSADGAGNVGTTTDPGGHQTAVTYQWGVPSATTTAHTSVSRVINPDGTVATEAIGGATSSVAYDALGRVTSATPPEGAATTTTYAADGSAVTVARAGAWTVTTLDGFGRPIATEDAAGVRTATSYDALGRRSSTSAPYTTTPSSDTFEYDALGRVRVVRHTDDSTVTYAYAGTTLSITDENGHSTVQHWWAFGRPSDARLVSVVDAAGQMWTYSYSATGALTRVDAPQGPDRTWTYDAAQRLVAESHPESGTTTYTYTAEGLLASQTDAANRTTTFAYDGDHRLISLDAPGTADDATLSYDSRGNRTVAAMGNGNETRFTYDLANRVTTREERVNGQIFLTTFGYNGRDDLTTVMYPSGGVVSYEYDAASRLTRVFSPTQTYADQISYHPSGARAGLTFGNGLTESLTLDGRQRPSRLVTGAVTDRVDLTYGYDAVGNVTAITDPRPGKSATYTYDALDRLATVTGFGANTFTYDLLGNRLTKGSAGVTYAYDPATNRLTSATSTVSSEAGQFQYDAVGNMAADGVGTFTYTARNQVATATLNQTTTAYAYDPDGRRIQKSSATGQQYFIRGPGGQLLAEYAALFSKRAPASGSSGNTTAVTLTWSSVPEATYEVCWDTTNNGSCDSAWQANQGQLTRTVSGLTPGTYYWQARATTANGTGQADNGTWWSFTIAEGAFGKLGPAPGAGTGSALTLSWGAVPGDPSYFFCFDTTNNSSCDTFWWPNGGTTSVYWDNLAPGTYYWQARVQLPSGQMFDADGGTWWSFTVGGGGSGFGKQTPAPGLSGLPSAVLLQWTAVPGEGYWVCWDTTNNATCDTGWYPNGGVTWFALDSLAEGTYYWQVKTHDVPMEADGGVWWAFTVGTAPATFGTQTPAHGAILTTNATTLWWDAAPGGQFYEVCLDAVNNGVCDTQWQLNGLPTSRGLAGLTDGTYYWQVRATTATGAVYANGGAWRSFTIDAPDPVREYIYLGDRLLAELSYSLTAPPVLTYYHTDVLGSVRAVTSATGAPLVRHDYFPFGESTSPLTGDPRRFTGKERDAETALDYFEARYYRNVWGRFTTADDSVFMDPADPQTFNRYAYVFNNPLRWTDPSGHQAQPPLRFTDAVTVSAKAPSDCFVLCEPEENGALTLTFALQNRELYRLGRGLLPLGEMAEQFAAVVDSPVVQLLGALPPIGSVRLASRLPHIFRAIRGHVVPQTMASRSRFMTLFERVASRPGNLRTDLLTPAKAQNGISIYTENFRNGQVWVEIRNGTVWNGGVNPAGAFR